MQPFDTGDTGPIRSSQCLKDPSMLGSVSSLFLSAADLYSIVPRGHQFIHSPVEGHFGCFRFGAIMSGTAVNIYVQIFV